VRGAISTDAINATYRPCFKPRWDGLAQDFISEVWQRYIDTNRHTGISIYNGALLRLDSFGEEGGGIRIDLSDVDFRSYVGTAIPEFRAVFPSLPQANPLAVCIVLTTSDNRIVIERRRHTDTYRQRYHVIGGFVEKEKDMGKEGPDPVGALRREIVEELGVLLEGVNRCTGLISTSMGTELCFSTPLSTTFEGLLRTKSESVTDAEIDDLVSVEDEPDSIVRFLMDHSAEIVSSGRACLLLHCREKYGQECYTEAVRRLSSP
jgi:hypothetical protein